jgi:hypothetical protein
MYCERTSTTKFAIQDLSIQDLELLQEALVILKSEKLNMNEQFQEDKKRAIEIYQEIDRELIISKEFSGTK